MCHVTKYYTFFNIIGPKRKLQEEQTTEVKRKKTEKPADIIGIN